MSDNITKYVPVKSCSECGYCGTNTDKIPAYCNHDKLYDIAVPFHAIHPDCPLDTLPDVEALQKELDEVKQALIRLVDLKKHKEQYGKDAEYLLHQPNAWLVAEIALSKEVKG